MDVRKELERIVAREPQRTGRRFSAQDNHEITVEEEYRFALPNGDTVVMYRNSNGWRVAVVIDQAGKTVAVSPQS